MDQGPRYKRYNYENLRRQKSLMTLDLIMIFNVTPKVQRAKFKNKQKDYIKV